MIQPEIMKKDGEKKMKDVCCMKTRFSKEFVDNISRIFFHETMEKKVKFFQDKKGFAQ